MATRPGLDRAEHVGRVTAFVFVVSSGSRPGMAAEKGRTSACNVTGFSSRQTTGFSGL
jgi:hypothetical protein